MPYIWCDVGYVNAIPGTPCSRLDFRLRVAEKQDVPSAAQDTYTPMIRPLLLFVCASLIAACGPDRKAAPPPAPTVQPPATGANEDREAYAKKEGLVLKQFDLNRDGQPDVFKYYREVEDPKNPGNKLEQLSRKDLDINHDGKIDIVRFYDAKGELTEERVDLDFDGRFDSVTFLANGVPARQEIDLSYDGKPEVTKYFDDGKLTRIEADRNSDGQIDTWEYYVNGELDRIGTDADLDGQADSWERKKAPDASTAPPAAAPAPAPGKAAEPSAAAPSAPAKTP